MTDDQVQIVLVAAGCAVGVGAVGLLAAWLVRHRSIRWQLGLIVVVSIGSVLAGVVAVSRLMFISHHDWEVVSLVAAVAGVVALVVALALGAAISRWSETLRQGARTLDLHGSYVADPRGPSELQALSEELARTSERLAESRLREARLESSRRELVSWVSHDLRTPLAGMRAMTEALEDGMAADPERYHRQIRVEVDRMARMVDDLFELSRIHAGVLAINPEPLALVDLVSEAIAGADPVARAFSVQLGGSAEDGVEVVADPAGLSRVLTNLVMNAVRHTPADGTVEILGRAVPDGVELSVRDECGGLSPEEMDRVFDVAWRGAAARTPQPEPAQQSEAQHGAGLGLAIVKGIVEAHRGVVEVENVGGPAGCRFRVLLPG
ncbi:two-component sensor histidine kinase [Nocardioides sp. MAH-18]|uniref:Sensor-like histidine kinase SenX3 n=1 Tax=Nocardioides agri TaxID=2682843 RepID=A0A6L6XL53_9ACTN|nr:MULTISPECIES: HAMP domain-containing sensor histidine kinase [unclassified Nocardioides]MBA2953112.1 HAMP domain-containing histidine kinase [Nocardioides sp. CGMCC 1.13656]MVQ47981.1 two-component sensor histidine kinase [Nocardioides sp. MAH-18]